MKKIMWFTKWQLNLLDELKTVTDSGNSAVVREAMIVYAEKLGLKVNIQDTREGSYE